ncbi:MAG TPA: hypothetical protein DDW17_03300 [Deltaproteobacteria bacterium]|nr:hypothetical protein [Deltaproteobacteria bacterium]
MGNPVRVQTQISSSGRVLTFPSRQKIANDLDYLAASLHARHSLMAEGERLENLSHIRSLSEFFRTIYPETELTEVLDFQRLLLSELIIELAGFRTYVSGPGADLIDWMLVRFQIENVKVLMRAYMTKRPMEEVEKHLVPLPKELALDIQKLAEAQSLIDFIRLLPKGFLRDTMIEALEIYSDNGRPFFFEAMLDCCYFQGLVARTNQITSEDNEIIRPIINQEIDIFHLMLISRGRFHYNIAPEMLKPLHVAGTRIPKRLFATMLNDADLLTSAGRIGRRILDIEPSVLGTEASTTIDIAALERLAWRRFFRLASLAFRKSHMGLGAIIGYIGLRQVEVANLITISEGIRSGMAPESIRKRLIPQSIMEGMHV